MNKRYLPVIAAFFILAIASTSFLPVFAVTNMRARAEPSLVVVTIPEDDEVHKTGVILLGLGDTFPQNKPDFLAQFKVSVLYNGLGASGVTLTCQVIEKDKYNPLKTKQGVWENLVSVPKDNTGNFACKYREGKPGFGVIDVYWVGPVAGTAADLTVGMFISDYILIVQFTKTIGRTVVYGTEMQDICVLGWPEDTSSWGIVTKPDGTEHYVFANPLGDYNSCEDLALVQKESLGLTIPWL